MSIKNQQGFIHIIILVAVALVAAGGVYYVVAQGIDSQGNTVEETTSVTQDQIDEANANNDELLNDGDYPALYKQYGLPEYPGATIKYDGRTADSLDDGISLKLTTSDDVQTVGAFYADEFASLDGWTYTPPNFSNETLYGATAEKSDEGLRYQLTVASLPDNTQINISFLKP